MSLRIVLLLAFGVVALAAIWGTGSAGHRPGVALANACSPARPHASGTSNEFILTPDGTRSYLIHVPPSYNGSNATPLVFNFHGITLTAALEEAITGLSTLSDQPSGKFIVVYPQGITTTGIPYNHFNSFQMPSPEPDDIAFTTQILDALEAQLCIDSNRVYSSGYSNGAFMSSQIACSLSSRFAAIGPVAGWDYPAATTDYPLETCNDTTPVPVIAFHGTLDMNVPFNGGPGGVPNVISLTLRLPIDNATIDEDVASDWAVHNTCTSSRQESQVDTEVRLIQYTGCDEGADVQLYIVDGGGHTWPGTSFAFPSLGYVTHQINASALMWDFFKAHTLTNAVADLDGDTIDDFTDNCPKSSNTNQADLDFDLIGDVCDSEVDGDGCSNVNEQETAIGSELTGGRRNYLNPNDYFNPSHDGQNRIDDVLLVVDAYFIDSGDPGYNADTDRTLVGPNAWNLGPPNGLQRVDDIVNIVKQYFHDCS